MPVQLGRPADGTRGDGWRAVEHQYVGAAVLEDFELAVDGIVRHIEGAVGDDQAGSIAEPFPQSAKQVASELVVLPEHGDLAVGIGGLDIVGKDPSLGAECRLPAHGPGKFSRMRPFLAAGGDEQLRNLALIEVLAGRKIV